MRLAPPPGLALWLTILCPVGMADELKQLADLRDRGALSPAEFEAAKGQLLSR